MSQIIPCLLNFGTSQIRFGVRIQYPCPQDMELH